jgi:hypothetical protein
MNVELSCSPTKQQQRQQQDNTTLATSRHDLHKRTPESSILLLMSDPLLSGTPITFAATR